MLAVLQTNGLRRASNKNVLGLSLLANTHLLYEEKPGDRIELLQLVWHQPTFTIHCGSTWLYQKAKDISPCHPWQAWSGSGSEICSPTKPRHGLFISFFKRLAAIPKNVRREPAPSALSRTDRGSHRLKQDSLPYIGHCNLLFFPLRPYVTAIVEDFCCKGNDYLFSQSEQILFFIPKYSSMISDLTSFKKYFFSSGESSSNPSSSAQISWSTQFSITSSFCRISSA